MRFKLNNLKAQEMIDQLGEEYKDLLIQTVLNETGETDADYLDLRITRETDAHFKRTLLINKQRDQNKKRYKILSLTGIIYSLIGFISLLITTFLYDLPNTPYLMIPVLTLLVGLMVVMSVLVVVTFSRNKDDKKAVKVDLNIDYMIVLKWKEIEYLIYEIIPTQKPMSFSSMLNYLKEIEILNKQEIEQLKEIISYRNKVVHNIDLNNGPKENANEILLVAEKIAKKDLNNIKESLKG